MKHAHRNLTALLAAFVAMMVFVLSVSAAAKATNADGAVAVAVTRRGAQEDSVNAVPVRLETRQSDPVPTQAQTTKLITTAPEITQAAKPTATVPKTTQTANTGTTVPAAVIISTQGKTLEQMYGTLAGSTRGYEAIQARISGNVLTIDVYVNFTGAYGVLLEGQTRAALAKQGIRLWAGAYTGSRYDFEPGMAFSVKVDIHDIYDGAGARGGQNYFDFFCMDATGRGFTFYGAGYYNREMLGTHDGALPDKNHTNGTICMYSGLSGGRYTASQYIKVSAHEFGHVLGLGDLYNKGVAATAECPQGKYYVDGDIMGSHGNVTPNNIEMMLEAYRNNRYQAYVNSWPEVKSSVIRSY